jgi:hypothetical protein
MGFEYSQQYADEVGQHFGCYRVTFVSDNAQVVAHLFEDDGDLVAYVSFPPGSTPDAVADTYLAALTQYAEQNGYGGRLRLRYT